jgi:tetratricopeptide (TPR) repeat protein
MVAGHRQGKIEVARHFAAMGAAVVKRVGDAPAWENCLHQNNALLAVRDGHHAEAAREAELAVTKSVEAYGTDDPHTVRAMGILGLALGELGRNEDALAIRLRTLEAAQRISGPLHIDVALGHSRVAESLLELQRLDEALRHETAAVEQYEKLLGKQDFRYGIALCIRGSIRSAQNDHRGALADLEAGLAAISAKQAPDSMMLAQPLTALAEAKDRAGRHAEAVADAERAVALLDAKLDPATPQTAYALLVLGNARLAVADKPGARAALERAVEIYRRAGEDVVPAHVNRALKALEMASAK